MSRESLVRRFADAGLTLVLSDRPIIGGIGGATREIVQIDIQRAVDGNRRQEWFRIFPGAEENRIEVVGTDKRIGQVVLMVHETAREFEEGVPWATLRHLQERDPVNWLDLLCKENGIRKSDVVVRKNKRGNPSVTVKRKTRSTKRHFLCGLDERQLFIAQLPKAVSTVRDAHACLKSTVVTLAEGMGINTVRQGEWFFLEVSQAEVKNIELGLEKKLLVIEQNVPIGPFTAGAVRGGGKVRQFRGNPHTADELLVLPGVPLGHGWAIRGRDVYVRGKVRHVDHKTVTFKGWRKVIRNAEPNQGQALGVGWVD